MSNEAGPFATMGFWDQTDLASALPNGASGLILNKKGVPYRMVHQWDRPQLQRGILIRELFKRLNLTIHSGYAPPKPAVTQISHPKAIREDGRCGKKFKAPDGSRLPGECHPVGRPAYGGGPECCNVGNGYCGSTEAHCTCAACIKYVIGNANQSR
eukprot:COSAG01_NODE_6497_length_3631_cov_1.901472_2_plen_156_part_00